MFPMFCLTIVSLYRTANEGYNPASPIKPAEDADNLQALFALDLKITVGCDFVWKFHDYEVP